MEIQTVLRFETMLKWARHRVHSKSFTSVVDARIEFRCCMDRLTRDLKLYRIAPQDLIKVIKCFLLSCSHLPSFVEWSISSHGKLQRGNPRLILLPRMASQTFFTKKQVGKAIQEERWVPFILKATGCRKFHISPFFRLSGVGWKWAKIRIRI